MIRFQRSKFSRFHEFMGVSFQLQNGTSDDEPHAAKIG